MQNVVSLAAQYGRYGYRRITALLRLDGWQVNHKRVERIWRQEGLKVPEAAAAAWSTLAPRRLLRPPARRVPEPRLVLRLRDGPDARWPGVETPDDRG